jgi:hypothetical protein
VPNDDFPLDLQRLGDGTLGLLTSACGTVMTEAAAVCFEDRSHKSGVRLRLSGIDQKQYIIVWPNVTEAQQRSYNDISWATEMGAYGVAILVISDVTRKTVIERSKKGTGFDYWIGDANADDDALFENKCRLEVSGILEGDDSAVAARVRKKALQVKPSDHLAPAYIAVIEFGQPKAQVEMK